MKETLTKAISGTALVLTLAGVGLTGDYYLNKDIRLANELYTQYEYEQIRPALVARMKDKKKLPSYKEAQMFVDALNIENNKEKLLLTGEGSVVDKLVRAMELRN